MTELATLLDRALHDTTFRTSMGATYSVAELREAYARPNGRVTESLEVLSARPLVDDVQIGIVVNHLRGQLSAYLQGGTDKIAHSFNVTGDDSWYSGVSRNYANEIQARSSLADFARGLIRSAAMLGSERTAQLLGQWANGEPRHFKILVVLAGVYVEEEISLDEGIRVHRLPVSSDSLPTSLPSSLPSMQGDSLTRMLGHAMLEVDASTYPALFVPPQGDDEYSPIALRTRTALGEISFDTLFLALSLVCNQQAGLAWSWNDRGDSGTLTETGRHSSASGPGMRLDNLSKSWTYHPSTGVVELSSFDPPPPNLCERGLRRAWELCTELQRRMASDQRFQIAVTRWAKAATPGELNADRLIDLRIALESLYLDSSGGELGFRLSITGARHLGVGLDEREEIRKTLADFYRLSSKVIHGTLPKGSAAASLVERTTKLCRNGILKIVEQRDRPDWTELLLG